MPSVARIDGNRKRSRENRGPAARGCTPANCDSRRQAVKTSVRGRCTHDLNKQIIWTSVPPPPHTHTHHHPPPEWSCSTDRPKVRSEERERRDVCFALLDRECNSRSLYNIRLISTFGGPNILIFSQFSRRFYPSSTLVKGAYMAREHPPPPLQHCVVNNAITEQMSHHFSVLGA